VDNSNSEEEIEYREYLNIGFLKFVDFYLPQMYEFASKRNVTRLKKSALDEKINNSKEEFKSTVELFQEDYLTNMYEGFLTLENIIFGFHPPSNQKYVNAPLKFPDKNPQLLNLTSYVFENLHASTNELNDMRIYFRDAYHLAYFAMFLNDSDLTKRLDEPEFVDIENWLMPAENIRMMFDWELTQGDIYDSYFLCFNIITTSILYSLFPESHKKMINDFEFIDTTKKIIFLSQNFLLAQAGQA
jgi:hypothetical protein